MYGFGENGEPEIDEEEARGDGNQASEADMESDDETGFMNVTDSDHGLDSDIEACVLRNHSIVTDFICRKLMQIFDMMRFLFLLVLAHLITVDYPCLNRV